MLDIGWPELFIILVIALLVIGPRDLPRAMHRVGKWVKQARAVTSEFQRHFDEMARESELEELREMKRKMSARGIKDEIDKTIDPTGDLRRDMTVKDGTALGDAKGAPVKPGNGASKADANARKSDPPAADPAADPIVDPIADKAEAKADARARPAPPAAVPGSAEPKLPEHTA